MISTNVKCKCNMHVLVCMQILHTHSRLHWNLQILKAYSSQERYLLKNLRTISTIFFILNLHTHPTIKSYMYVCVIVSPSALSPSIIFCLSVCPLLVTERQTDGNCTNITLSVADNVKVRNMPKVLIYGQNWPIILV